LFSSVLDTVNQATIVAGSAEDWSEASVPAGLRGSIRMSILMGGQQMLTDTQLLDGRVFLALGPAGFERLVAAFGSHGPWPLEVVTRHGDLAACLRGLVVSVDRPDAPLAGFWFSVLSDDPTRERVKKALDGLTVRELDEAIAARGGVAAGLAHVLEVCGGGPGECAALARAWQDWIDAQRHFAVREGPVTHLLADPPAPAMVSAVRERLAALGAPAGCFAAVDRLVGPDVVTRSDAYAVLAPLTAPDEREPVAEIKRWVNAWHQQVIADRVDALVVTPRDDAGPYADAHCRLFVEPTVSRELSEMPPTIFSDVRYQVRHDSPQWWSEVDRKRRRAQRRLAFTLHRTTEKSDLGQARLGVLTKLLVLLGAVAIAAVPTSGVLLTVVVFVVAFALSVASELRELWRLRPGHLDQVFELRLPAAP
jgi:hypothetical protein